MLKICIAPIQSFSRRYTQHSKQLSKYFTTFLSIE